MKLTAYCYDSNGKMYKKIDCLSFTKIEDIGSCIMVTLDRYHTVLIDKKKFINFVFYA